MFREREEILVPAIDAPNRRAYRRFCPKRHKDSRLERSGPQGSGAKVREPDRFLGHYLFPDLVNTAKADPIPHAVPSRRHAVCLAN